MGLSSRPARRGSIRPKYMWQFLHPFAFCIIQPFLQPTYYNFIYSFCLSIPLGISRSRIPISNPQLTTVSSKHLAVGLKAVVKDEHMKNSKSSDNVLPNESFCNHISNVGQMFRFNPLCKIIRADQEIFLISHCFGKWSHNV